MKSHKILSSANIIIITAFFALIGCTTTTPMPTVVGEAITLVHTSTATLVLPTQTSLPVTLTPSIIPTLTPAPSSTPTSTSTMQPTATEIPNAIPTPPGENATEQVLWLLETNNGCQLPCWWGIIPGETEWEVAEQFFNTFVSNIPAASNPQLINYSPQIPLPTEVFEIAYTSPIYSVRDSIVDEILTDVSIGDSTPSAYLTSYLLSTFLTTYGQPEEIWLSTYRASFEEGDLPFFVILIYPNQGIIALYDDNGKRLENVVQGCPQRNPVSILKLWSPHSSLTFEQIIEGSSALRKDYLPLKQATEMSVTTFYETFKNPDNTTCLHTPANLWR